MELDVEGRCELENVTIDDGKNVEADETNAKHGRTSRGITARRARSVTCAAFFAGAKGPALPMKGGQKLAYKLLNIVLSLIVFSEADVRRPRPTDPFLKIFNQKAT
jgi:hypothetical protein